MFLSDVWPTPEDVRETVAGSIGEEMFRATYADVFTGDETWRELPVPEGELFAWDPASTYVRHPPYFDGMPPEPGAVEDVVGARCLVSVGDSVTTDHISPAGSIKPDSPGGPVPDRARRRAKRLQLVRLAAREPRGDGARHVRERPAAQPARSRARRGPGPSISPRARRATIFDTAERYRAEGIPLIVLAGKEYGSGSSRDWAAKGPKLLGVRAVIAESYERIHRSNLLMMGILPLQFLPGESLASLGLTGREEFSITGVANGEAREVYGACGRDGVPRDCPAGHPARARVPPPRRDPPLRAAAAARGVITPSRTHASRRQLAERDM